MKKNYLLLFLLCLIGMAGNIATVMAQVPEPSGQWKFDNSSDLMAAAVGNITLSPAVMDGASVSPATVSEAGIVAAEGARESAGIFVPAASALKVERAEGAEASTNYTWMIDLKVPDAYVYDGLFQTSTGNSNDGEVFISKSQIGANAMGGYFGCIWNDVWYRVVFTNSNGSLKLYVNGVKLTEYETDNGRWEIDPVFYLHADDDGEMSDTYISEVAFWETPLTDAEVAELGSLDDFPWITDVSQIKEGDQFYIISDRARFNGSSTAKPKAMAPIQAHFSINWGDQYVYWGDLDKESDGFVWTAEKAGEQWAFLNKENNKYLGNMNEGESDVIFSDTPVGYTLTDLTEGAGRFYMTNEESEHSLHVQGYLRSDRGNNSLAKQNVGDDDYENANSVQNGYPGRWRLLKLNAEEPVETGMKIETLDDFLAFAEAVSNGETTLEAYLAADIELTDNTMVSAYAGTFDGKGHKITYNYTNVGDHSGLFTKLNDGAVIRNLYIEGSAVVKGIHFGALAGDYMGNVLVENVVTNVNITGDRSGVTGDGGMAGYVDGKVTFNNCATLGKMGNTGTSMYCGFVAYATDASVSTLNNCYTTCELTEGTGTGYCFTFCRGTATYNNCFYLNVIGTKDGGTQVTAEQVASGELCFKLNGDQSTIGWYQTLAEDAFPVPFASHSQVYANGTARCDGAELPDSPIVYSNTEGQIVIPDHQYGEDGTCIVCGSPTQNAEGYYLIDTVQKLNWFATKTSEGTTDLNALLTADIDLSTSDYPNLMIGTEASEYAGIFDGGGHTITYNYALVADKWRGLFAFVNGATIRNLYVEGSAVVTNIHYGALIGRAYGTVLVENVITNVNITGQRSGVTGDGGMLGANYANITFNNCATLGEMGCENSSMYSSFSAWSNGSSSTTLNNCYSLCKLTEGTGTGNCFTLTHQSGTNTINNCYYLNAIGKVLSGNNIDQTQVTEEEVANGSLCAKLGNGWYQNIGEDAYPIFDKTHATVKEITEAGYATMYIPNAVDVPDGVSVYTGEYEEDWLKLNAVEGSVPAWEPVVLKGAPGLYSFLPATPIEVSEDVVFADLGLADAEDIPETKVEELTLSFADGGNTNAPRYYANGSAARIYGSNSMTISAATPITKIEFAFAGANYVFTSGGFEVSDGTYALATKTWTGNAESVTFTNTSTKQWRIVSMKVTYAGYPENIAGNVLKGAAENIDATGKYILAQPEGEPVGFYLANGGTIKAGKAYLEDGSGVKAFYFEGDDATGIDAIENEQPKVNNAIYNLAGQRISKMQKGINIVNGRKILK